MQQEKSQKIKYIVKSESSKGDSGSPAELYHENSKIHPGDTELFANIHTVNTHPRLRKIISRPFTSWTGYPVIELPENKKEKSQFEEILTSRRSTHDFSGEPMSMASLERLLFLGDGIITEFTDNTENTWYLRTAPSGGGLYPIDLYFFAFNVEGLDKGLYFYSQKEHHLERIKKQDYSKPLQEATNLHREVGNASLCIALTCLMNRNTFKYGNRAYRFALLEAGHIAQNILLTAEYLKLGALPVGGFVDDKVNALMKLDGCEEFVSYMILIGQSS